MIIIVSMIMEHLMKNLLKNSVIFILFIFSFLFSDVIYKLFDNKEYNFNYLKDNELNYYKDEYQKLSGIKNDNNYILSKIIYRNIYDFYSNITISKGKNNAIKKGNVVVSEDGLIGIVSKVNRNSSVVNLVTNKDSKISVKINDTYGILESKNNKLYVTNLVSESDIKKDMIVYTSGLTDIIENIKIGKVKNIRITKDKLEKIVEVELFTNIKNIDYVMVIE